MIMATDCPKNPFVVNRYLGGEYFCDREVETEILTHQLANERDVGLISPRRLGKTGLIHHVLQQPEIKDHFYTFFVDIYSTTSFEEMVYLLGKSIFEQLKPKRNLWADKFFQIVASLRAGLKMDAITGLPELELGIGEIKSPSTTLDEIFRYLQQADKPCIVAIDEFQQILNYSDKNTEAILRTKIQQTPNVRWIFAGSQQHMLQAMFSSPKRPFYQSALTMTLHPIDCDTYALFCQNLFLSRGKHLDAEVVENVYARYRGCTWYLQMMMNELFSRTEDGAKCTVDMIPRAEANILYVLADGFKQRLSTIPAKQKGLLLAIAREGEVTGITSTGFVEKYGLGSASSVQSALKKLLDLDLVTNDSGTYYLSDHFLAQWLRKNY